MAFRPRPAVTSGSCAGIGALLGALLCAWLLLPAEVPAQPAPLPPPAAQTARIYSAAQLDQMLAPIALYPDDLLGQILMAATYPLDVVNADRWLQDPAHAGLSGQALAQAVQPEPWDASVKSLTIFPQILSMMDSNLQWTEELGEAFVMQQSDVMDHVQQLRSRARAAGTLVSTPQETVTADGQMIEIAPAGPSMVYVPVYNPDVVYGEWPYPDELPYYFDYPGYALGTYIGFVIFAPFWGWHHWDWHHHRLDIGAGAGYGAGGPSLPLRPGPWQYDPAHRGGVPYHSGPAQARFGAAAGIGPSNESFRGYAPSAGAPPRPSPPVVRPTQIAPAAPPPRPAPPAPRMEEPLPRPSTGFAERPAPPAFESFGRGPEVRAQEQRGSSSRMSAPSGGTRVRR